MSEAEVRKSIVQGEQLVMDDARVVASTILGSSLAGCLRDPVAGAGGMNHVLFPGSQPRQHGVHAMARLINDLLARGGRRERMPKGMTGIGVQNSVFALQFLSDEAS